MRGATANRRFDRRENLDSCLLSFHRLTVGIMVAGLLVLGGCGSSTPTRFKGPTYSAAQVRVRFQAVAGLALQTTQLRAGWPELQPSDAESQDPAYGLFTIDVLRSPKVLPDLTDSNNQPVKPDEHGVYWDRVPGTPPTWSAAKVYGNLVLSVPTGTRRALPAAFATLDHILTTLGEPLATARVGVPSVPQFSGGTYTAQQVAARFQALTGETLEIQPNAVTWDSLDPTNSLITDDRYGVFNIDVLHNPESFATIAGGGNAKPGPGGVYWTYDPSAGGGWTAVKAYGNVVLEWGPNPRRQLGPGFRMLDQILSSLGQAATPAGPGAPPPQCAAAGIAVDGSGSRQGTCMDNSVRVTVVNRASQLVLATFTAALAGLKTGNRITAPYLPAQRAKGIFLIVALRITNTGRSAIVGLDDADLVLPGRYYTTDDAATAALRTSSLAPLRHGASTVLSWAFDMPPSAVAAARRTGAILVPGDPAATVQTSASAGEIRLGG